MDCLRLRRAAQPYASGAVPSLLPTGSGIGGDSATTMKAEIPKIGVPPEAVLLEPRSTATRENLLFAAPLVRARGWRRVLRRLPRGQGGARGPEDGAEVEWLPVPVPDAGPFSRVYKQRFAEWAKLAMII